jgi:Ca-activated chloride channel family protein
MRNLRNFINFLLFALVVIVLFSVQGAGQTPENMEKVTVDSNLVDLNVSIFSRKPQLLVPQLKQSDFRVLDNGEPQEIAFFSTTEAPFDLILMLDLSGSVQEKLDLIKKSALKFVNAARPIDRIGLVTFAGDTRVVAPLTSDRDELEREIKKKIKKPNGGTLFWDAMAKVLNEIVATKNDGRRTAIIVMTDGVDNALSPFPGVGSKINFLELVEIIRRSDATILPIYLDTEDEESRLHGTPSRAYELARKSLAIMAVESGGIAYQANKIEDLNGVYENVINDLGHFYSIGYQPPSKAEKGEFRKVSVEIIGKPELAARTRKGYYAK